MVRKRNIIFNKSGVYHVLTKTVEQRKIFVDKFDCLRFIFQMYAANIGKPSPNMHRRDIAIAASKLLVGKKISEKLIIVEHLPLVNNLSFSLVTTHNHFILNPNFEYSIPKYFQKLNTGFAMYYNLKYRRKGNLFEKPYKIIPIETNFQLDAIIRYVNVKNPLDVYQPGWRINGLKDEGDAFSFLKNYPFSSFPDLFSDRSSKILAPYPILAKYLGKGIVCSKKHWIEFIKGYLRGELSQFKPFFLED